MSSQRWASSPGAPAGSEPEGPAATLALDLETAKLSDTGQSRPHNEDYVGYFIPTDPQQLARKGAFYLVADGMGGHSAGEVASEAAVELAIGHYYSDSSDDVGTSLVNAFQEANRLIYEQAQADPSKSGMGTTLVAAVILGRKVYLANVGDSRAYLVNGRGITQITEDHSWVAEQMRAGLLTKKEARRHPQRNVVTRAMASRPTVEVDLFEGEIGDGDMLLLCSDGLTGLVEDQEIAAIMLEHPPKAAAQLLVDQANARGGTDNITVLIVSARPQVVEAPTEIRPVPVRAFPVVPLMAGVAVVMVLALAALAWPYWSKLLPGSAGGATLVPVTATLPIMASSTPGVSVTVPVVVETPGPSQTPVTELTPTSTLRPTTPLPPTETEVPPTDTAVPPTDTPVLPTDTAPPPTPGETPQTDTPEAPTDTPSPTTEPAAPALVMPVDGAGPLHGWVTFSWSYPSPLEEGQAFRVQIWPVADVENKWSSIRVKQDRELEINLDDDVPVITVPGAYAWSVVLLDGNDEPIGNLAEPRQFTYGPE